MRSEGYRDLVKCSVEIELGNGKVLLGVIERPRAKSLTDHMNSGEPFIEVRLFDGSLVQVGKASMLYCRQRDGSKSDPLAAVLKASETDNPLVVLGLTSAENREQVRRAYLVRMRLYHSDRYGGIELPAEVAEHMATMTKRINVAYRDALAMCGQAAEREREPA